LDKSCSPLTCPLSATNRHCWRSSEPVLMQRRSPPSQVLLPGRPHTWAMPRLPHCWAPAPVARSRGKPNRQVRLSHRGACPRGVGRDREQVLREKVENRASSGLKPQPNLRHAATQSRGRPRKTKTGRRTEPARGVDWRCFCVPSYPGLVISWLCGCSCVGLVENQSQQPCFAFSVFIVTCLSIANCPCVIFPLGKPRSRNWGS
jgi:hypothetical protein